MMTVSLLSSMRNTMPLIRQPILGISWGAMESWRAESLAANAYASDDYDTPWFVVGCLIKGRREHLQTGRGVALGTVSVPFFCLFIFLTKQVIFA